MACCHAEGNQRIVGTLVKDFQKYGTQKKVARFWSRDFDGHVLPGDARDGEDTGNYTIHLYHKRLYCCVRGADML